MSYIATWVNRVDAPHKVEIDLNLTNGNLFRKIPFQWFKTPAEVDAAFLAGVATAAITRIQSEEDANANIAAFVAANLDLRVFSANLADIATLVTRNSLPYTQTQVRDFMIDLLNGANIRALRDVAERRYA